MANSSRSKPPASDRPAKPKGSPLYPHPLGYWSRKINGKIFHFGRWGRVVKGVVTPGPGREPGYADALAEHNRQFPDITAGRVRETVIVPKAAEDVLTVRVICNAFIRSKRALLESGEITARTFAEYRQTTDRLIEFFGKEHPVDDIRPTAFERLRQSIAKTYGAVRLGNEIVRVRSVFKYSRKSDLVPEEFKKPSKKTLRVERAKKEKRLFTAEELRAILDAAPTVVRAMTLLALNCGFGNSDIAELKQSHVDLKRGWVEFPRPKTGIERRCPLWPETVAALKQAIAERPEPAAKADAACVFLTLHGHRYVREFNKTEEQEDGTELIKSVSQSNEVGVEFGRVLNKLKMKRAGVGFYGLRHTFRTISDASKDFPAVRLIMGHVDSSIDATYREHIDDDRLVAVSEHVREWLNWKPKTAKGGEV